MAPKAARSASTRLSTSQAVRVMVFLMKRNILAPSGRGSSSTITLVFPASILIRIFPIRMSPGSVSNQSGFHRPSGLFSKLNFEIRSVDPCLKRNLEVDWAPTERALEYEIFVIGWLHIKNELVQWPESGDPVPRHKKFV